MLDHEVVFKNVLNELFFEMFVRSNQGIREFCEKRCFDIEEIKDILFRRQFPTLPRITELIEQCRATG